MATTSGLALHRQGKKDFEPTGKQMLVVSVHDLDGGPILKIEEEPHYWYTHRRILFEKELPSLNTAMLLNDFSLCEDIAYKIFLSTLIRQEGTASLVSIHDYHGYPLIRFDIEKYAYKDHRKLITQIPLPSVEMEITGHDIRIRHAIGKKILGFLLNREPGKQ